MFRLCGNRRSGSPLRYASSTLPRIESCRWSRSFPSRALSAGMTSSQISAARPKPTMSGTGSVPEAVRLHRDGRPLAPLPLEPLAGVEPRALLDRRRDDVVTLLAVHLGDAFQRQVDRLGATRGEHDLLGVARADEARDLRPRGVDGALGLPPEGMVPARGMTEPLGEVGQHRLDDSRVARCRRLRIHEDPELHGHRLGLLSPQARIDKSFGTSSFVSSARLIVSSIWVIAAWSFWTGRRRLHRGSCGQPPWSRQLTMLMGPSSARITSPTVISLGWRECT